MELSNLKEKYIISKLWIVIYAVKVIKYGGYSIENDWESTVD